MALFRFSILYMFLLFATLLAEVLGVSRLSRLPGKALCVSPRGTMLADRRSSAVLASPKATWRSKAAAARRRSMLEPEKIATPRYRRREDARAGRRPSRNWLVLAALAALAAFMYGSIMVKIAGFGF